MSAPTVEADKAPKTPELSSVLIGSLNLNDGLRSMLQDEFDNLLKHIEDLKNFYEGIDSQRTEAETKFFESDSELASKLAADRDKIEQASAKLAKAKADYDAALAEAVKEFMPDGVSSAQAIINKYDDARAKIVALQTLAGDAQRKLFRIPNRPTGPRDPSKPKGEKNSETAEARAWLNEHGYDAGNRGRISEELMATYHRESGK